MQSAYALFYCQLWPVWLHRIFAHYLIDSTILRKKIIEYKMYFDLLYNFDMK